MKISLRHHYIEIYVFLFVLIFSITNTLIQQMVFKNICLREYGMRIAECQSDGQVNDSIQKLLSTYTAKLASFTFYIGSLTPLLVTFIIIHYKTTSIMLVQLFNYTIIGLLMLSYNSIQSFPHEALIYSAGFFLALCSITGFMVLTFEYISTISEPSQRTIRFAILFVFINSGLIVGQLSFGFIIKSLGFSYSIIIYISTVLCATITYITMMDFSELPISSSNLVFNEEEKESYWESLKKCYYEFKEFPRKDKICIFLLFISNSFYFFIIYGQSNINIIFLLSKEIKATSVEIGLYTALQIGIPTLSVLFLLPFIKRFLPIIPDFVICMIGELISSAFIISFGLAGSKANILKILPLTIFNNFTNTISSSRVSRFFSGKQRVIFYGIDNAISSALGTLGTILFLKLYNATVSTHPGIVYVVIGCLRLVSAGFIISFIHISTDRINRSEANIIEENTMEN